VLILDNTINKLLTVNFLVTNPGRSPHDGVVDFGITLTSVTEIGGSPDFTNSFPSPSKNGLNLPGTEFNQVVEVQTPEPSTILSLLALGTLGAASTLKRKLKPSQSTEKETTKVS
ncbi:MAG: PEP-CTERM sorting domain-containing protein, partial [Microcystis sp.]|uniref:PEP-CTERM sorting domain-containing protein n=1 Tax=Microcystis sp. TaxID=1127 RepID=UPI0039198A24